MDSIRKSGGCHHYNNEDSDDDDDDDDDDDGDEHDVAKSCQKMLKVAMDKNR